MENVAAFALIEPEDALGSEHLLGHLVVQEVLELAQREGTITFEGQGGESLDLMMVMAVLMTVAVPMAVVVPMAVIMRMIVVMAAVAMVVVAVAVIQAWIVGSVRCV